MLVRTAYGVSSGLSCASRSSRAGIKFVFAGHYHRNAQGASGELQMVTTGPVGMPLGEAKSGFRAVWAIELHHRYFDFGALPVVIPPLAEK